MRVSRRSLLSRLFDDGDWLEDWEDPGPAGLESHGDDLLVNMSQAEANMATARTRDEAPWIDPRLARGGSKSATRSQGKAAAGSKNPARSQDAARRKRTDETL